MELTCDKCNKIFQSKQANRYHIDRNSCIKYDYRCSECGKDFMTKQRYMKHINAIKSCKDINNEFKLKCKECDKVFTTNQSLKRHAKLYCKSNEEKEIINLNEFGKENKEFITKKYIEKYVNYDLYNG